MKTLERIREVYNSQKQESHSIAFFWVGSKYIALFDDAQFINCTLNYPLSLAEIDGDSVPYIAIEEGAVMNVSNDLVSKSLVSVCIVETQEFEFQ